MNASSKLAKPIRQLMEEKLSVDVAADDADLLAEGVLDSVTLVQLIMHLEQSFQVRIDLGVLEIDDLRSVNAIASLVSRLQTADECEMAQAIAGTV